VRGAWRPPRLPRAGPQAMHTEQVDDRKQIVAGCGQVDDMYDSLAAHEQKVGVLGLWGVWGVWGVLGGWVVGWLEGYAAGKKWGCCSRRPGSWCRTWLNAARLTRLCRRAPGPPPGADGGPGQARRPHRGAGHLPARAGRGGGGRQMGRGKGVRRVGCSRMSGPDASGLWRSRLQTYSPPLPPPAQGKEWLADAKGAQLAALREALADANKQLEDMAAGLHTGGRLEARPSRPCATSRRAEAWRACCLQPAPRKPSLLQPP
jgi:hypothetical protein